jgi:hypothetical protein
VVGVAPQAAAFVSTITLPSTGHVIVAAQSFGLNSLAVAESSPSSIAICSGCGTNTALDLGSYSSATSMVFTLTDNTCHQNFLSTDSHHAEITQNSATSWTIGWDDAGGNCMADGDFNDLIETVSLGGTISAAETALAKAEALNHMPSCVNGSRPVDCASGDFWHTFTDVSVPGRGRRSTSHAPTTRSAARPRGFSGSAGPHPTKATWPPIPTGR